MKLGHDNSSKKVTVPLITVILIMTAINSNDE